MLNSKMEIPNTEPCHDCQETRQDYQERLATLRAQLLEVKKDVRTSDKLVVVLTSRTQQLADATKLQKEMESLINDQKERLRQYMLEDSTGNQRQEIAESRCAELSARVDALQNELLIARQQNAALEEVKNTKSKDKPNKEKKRGFAAEKICTTSKAEKLCATLKAEKMELADKLAALQIELSLLKEPAETSASMDDMRNELQRARQRIAQLEEAKKSKNNNKLSVETKRCLAAEKLCEERGDQLAATQLELSLLKHELATKEEVRGSVAPSVCSSGIGSCNTVDLDSIVDDKNEDKMDDISEETIAETEPSSPDIGEDDRESCRSSSVMLDHSSPTNENIYEILFRARLPDVLTPIHSPPQLAASSIPSANQKIASTNNAMSSTNQCPSWRDGAIPSASHGPYNPMSNLLWNSSQNGKSMKDVSAYEKFTALRSLHGTLNMVAEGYMNIFTDGNSRRDDRMIEYNTRTQSELGSTRCSSRVESLPDTFSETSSVLDGLSTNRSPALDQDLLPGMTRVPPRNTGILPPEETENSIKYPISRKIQATVSQPITSQTHRNFVKDVSVMSHNRNFEKLKSPSQTCPSFGLEVRSVTECLNVAAKLSMKPPVKHPMRTKLIAPVGVTMLDCLNRKPGNTRSAMIVPHIATSFLKAQDDDSMSSDPTLNHSKPKRLIETYDVDMSVSKVKKRTSHVANIDNSSSKVPEVQVKVEMKRSPRNCKVTKRKCSEELPKSIDSVYSYVNETKDVSALRTLLVKSTAEERVLKKRKASERVDEDCEVKDVEQSDVRLKISQLPELKTQAKVPSKPAVRKERKDSKPSLELNSNIEQSDMTLWISTLPESKTPAKVLSKRDVKECLTKEMKDSRLQELNDNIEMNNEPESVVDCETLKESVEVNKVIKFPANDNELTSASFSIEETKPTLGVDSSKPPSILQGSPSKHLMTNIPLCSQEVNNLITTFFNINSVGTPSTVDNDNLLTNSNTNLPTSNLVSSIDSNDLQRDLPNIEDMVDYSNVDNDFERISNENLDGERMDCGYTGLELSNSLAANSRGKSGVTVVIISSTDKLPEFPDKTHLTVMSEAAVKPTNESVGRSTDVSADSKRIEMSVDCTVKNIGNNSPKSSASEDSSTSPSLIISDRRSGLRRSKRKSAMSSLFSSDDDKTPPKKRPSNSRNSPSSSSHSAVSLQSPLRIQTDDSSQYLNIKLLSPVINLKRVELPCSIYSQREEASMKGVPSSGGTSVQVLLEKAVPKKCLTYEEGKRVEKPSLFYEQQCEAPMKDVPSIEETRVVVSRETACLTDKESVTEMRGDKEWRCKGSVLKTCYQKLKDGRSKGVKDRQHSREEYNQRAQQVKLVRQATSKLALLDDVTTRGSTALADMVATLDCFDVRNVVAGVLPLLDDDKEASSQPDETVPPPAPRLSPTQRRLVTLVMAMKPEAGAAMLAAMQTKICHLGRDILEDSAMRSYVAVYTALCLARHDYFTLRTLLYDMVYCCKYRVYTIAHQMFTLAPHVLPHAFRSKDDLVSQTLVCSLLTLKNNKPMKECPIRSLLVRNYKYNPTSSFNAIQIVDEAINRLNSNCITGVELALVLLCKRQGWVWSELNVSKRLLAMLHQPGNVPARCVIARCLAHLARIVPKNRLDVTSKTVQVLEQLFLTSTEPEVQEAALSCLAGLSWSRQQRAHLTQLLLAWTPRAPLSDALLARITSFMTLDPQSLWQKVLNC